MKMRNISSHLLFQPVVQGVAQEVQTWLNKYKKRISCVVYLNGIAYQWEFLSAFIACIALLVHQILKCSFDSVRRYV